jgi:hypothetical protein
LKGIEEYQQAGSRDTSAARFRAFYGDAKLPDAPRRTAVTSVRFDVRTLAAVEPRKRPLSSTS